LTRFSLINLTHLRGWNDRFVVMVVRAELLRAQPFPSVLATPQRQGFAAPGCKKRSPPLTPLRGEKHCWRAQKLTLVMDQFS
jgi:hypothetical protein